MQNISALINQGLFQKALEAIKSYEEQNPNDEILQFNKCGYFIDIGLGLNDPNLVRQGLSIGEQLLHQKNMGYKARLHYNLANGYSYLYSLTERGLGVEAIPQSGNLQKAKTHFREAVDPDDHSSNFQKRVWTNYGNCLDALGRGMEALYAYENALRIDKEFSMAIGNKAKALHFFADISGQYRTAIYIEAYQLIRSVIDKRDLVETGGLLAKQAFEKELRNIESLFKDKNDLTKKLKHSKYGLKQLSDFEKFYINFCVKEKLFLNFHLHREYCKAAVMDPIFISLITKVDDDETFYKFAKYINQIKEDYAVARLLLVQSQYRRRDFDNISKKTTFVNSLDYSQFDIYVGLLKASFKGAYNILDKIGGFINDYYRIGLSEDYIYFTSVWERDKKIRNELLRTKNISLYALYDIYQDFKSGYYQKIRGIRNALVHRRLVIFDSVLTDWDKKEDKYNIGYNAMLEKTIELMRLVKSSIVYLINFVNIEENKKRAKDKFIPSIQVDTSQFFY